jgi:hypothetical protein
MKRIITVLAVAALMAAMTVLPLGVAFAAANECPTQAHQRATGDIAYCLNGGEGAQGGGSGGKTAQFDDPITNTTTISSIGGEGDGSRHQDSGGHNCFGAPLSATCVGKGFSGGS